MIRLKNILLENPKIIKQLIDKGVIPKSKEKEALAIFAKAKTSRQMGTGKVDLDKEVGDQVAAIPEYPKPSYVGPEWFKPKAGYTEDEIKKMGKAPPELFKWMQDNNLGKAHIAMSQYAGSAKKFIIYPEGKEDVHAQQLVLMVDKGDTIGPGGMEIGVMEIKMHIGNAHMYEELKKQIKLTKPRPDKKSKMLLSFGVVGDKDLSLKDLDEILTTMVNTPKPPDKKVKASFWDKFKLTNYLPKDKSGKAVGGAKGVKMAKAAADKKIAGHKADAAKYKADSKARMAKRSKPSKGSVFN